MSAVAAAGCAGVAGPMVAGTAPAPRVACRTPVAPDGHAAAVPIAWIAPQREQDRNLLDAWCRSTGSPVLAPLPPGQAPGADGLPQADELIVVSWNLHVGTADLPELVRRLKAGAFTDGRPVARFVLLLQEAYRDDLTVPRALPRGVRAPKALGRDATGHERTDVVRLAGALGLAVYYVPSMRNGAPSQTTEDRGNAILSTEPLTDFAAIELPFERQRRVAVAATVSSRTPTGEPWTLRVASVHLESTASARRLWVAAHGARIRQARGLLDAMQPRDALIVGGDFNTWLGFSDPTYKVMAAAMPDAAAGDRRRTFGGLFRLDHVFSRPPAGWTVTARRLDVRLGSDHYPLLARVRRPLGPGEHVTP